MGEADITGRSGADARLVLALLAGAWTGALGSTWRAGLDHQATLRAMEAAPEVAAGDVAFAPLPYPRALRQADGIGRRRSMDLARFHWQEGWGAPADLIHGVGTRTAKAARGVVKGLLGPLPRAKSIKDG